MDENWIKLYETTNEDEILKYLKKEFDKNNIKYKVDLEEKWEGIRIPKYIRKFVVYVQDKFENGAEKVLNQYYENNKATIKEVNEIQELNVNEEDDTEIESKKIAKKQKRAVLIYIGIVICMLITIIVAAQLD